MENKFLERCNSRQVRIKSQKMTLDNSMRIRLWRNYFHWKGMKGEKQCEKKAF